MTEREQARLNINSRPLTDFIPLQESRKGPRSFDGRKYACPVCGSGANAGSDSDTGFMIYGDGGRYRCICRAKGCFNAEGEDTLGALRIVWGCTEKEVFFPFL